MFRSVDPRQDFPKMEEKILEFWNKNDIFRKSIESRPADNEFSFYDGPPFATGHPHYGHLVPGTIKDIIPRYQTMKGHRVYRNWGWDCHGLPVENEMKKKLGISSAREINEYGVAGEFHGIFNRIGQAGEYILFYHEPVNNHFNVVLFIFFKFNRFG